jgi:hypothetical protein
LNWPVWEAIRLFWPEIRLILKKKTAGDESCGLSNRPLLASFVPQKIILEKSMARGMLGKPASVLNVQLQDLAGWEAIMG